eukprot:SM000246S08210  [mRNA]  locus=s246:161186:166397:- [translate_table: standard]
MALQALALGSSLAEPAPVTSSERLRLDMLRQIKERTGSVPALPELSRGKPAARSPTVAAVAPPEGISFPSLVSPPGGEDPAKAADAAPSQTNVGTAETKATPLRPQILVPPKVESGSPFSVAIGGAGVGAGLVAPLVLREQSAKKASEASLTSAQAEVRALTQQLEEETRLLESSASEQMVKAQKEQKDLTDKLSSYQAMGRQLEAELERAQKQVAEVKQQLIDETGLLHSRAQEQAALAKEEQSKLLSKLSAQQDVSKDLEKQLAAAMTEQSELSSKMSKQQELNNNLGEELAAEKSAAATLKQKVDDVHSALREAQDLNKDMEMSLKTAGEKEQQLSRDAVSKSALLQEREEEVASLKKEANQIKQQLAEVQSQISSLEDSLEAKSRVYEEKEQENASLMESADQIKQELAKAEGHVSGLKESLEASTQAFKNKEQELQQLVKDMQSASESIAELDKLTTSLKNDIASLSWSLEEEKSTAKQLRDALQASQDALEVKGAEATSVAEKLRAAESHSESLEGRLLELTNALTSTQQALEEEESVAGAAKAQVEASQEALEEEKRIVTSLREGVNQASEALEGMHNEVQELLSQIQEADKRIESMNSELSVLQASLDTSNQALQKVQEEAVQLKANIAQVTEEKEASLKRVSRLEIELSSTKGEMLRLRGQNTEATRALEAAEAKLQDIAKVRAEAAMMVEHYEDSAAREKEEKEMLQLKVDKLEREAKAAATAAAELSSVRSELTSVQKSLSDAQTARAEAEAAVTSLQLAGSRSDQPQASPQRSKKPIPANRTD